jgi:hypothetical protein
LIAVWTLSLNSIDDIKRADTIRGVKALLLLFGVPTIFAVLWQSTTSDLLHVVLVLLSIAAVAGWVYRYRKHREPQSVGQLLTPKVNRVGSLIERYPEIIATQRNRIQLSGFYEIDNCVRDCITAIAQHERRADIAPEYEYLYRWERRSDIPDEYRQLTNQLKTDFENRAAELRKLKDEQLALQAEKILSTNWDLVEKFLEITERKVSVLDDYGDEHWNVLPEEIYKLLKKITEREGLTVHWESVKPAKDENWKSAIQGMSWSLADEYGPIPTRLHQIFVEHHERVKSKDTDTTDFQSLSGVEFETYVAKILRSRGYDVQGTPTTGDQGADLIAKKDGRTIIVQAKRYQGTVGNKAVQEVISAVRFYGGDEGWVVTTSSFTPSAVALAQKANVKLIDGTALRNKSIL